MEEWCSEFARTSKRLRDIWNIGKRLRQDDIEKLNFICVGLIPEGILHKLDGSLLLKEIAEIRTNECVIEALIRIDRMDLLSQLTGEHEAAKRKYSSLNTTKFDRLRIVLLYIAKNMTDTEGLELLKAIVKPKIDDKGRLQRVQTALDLFDLLIHNVILIPSRPETVTEVFHIYETEPWFDKVRSEYVAAADTAAAMAAKEETTTVGERIGIGTESQLFPYTAGKGLIDLKVQAELHNVIRYNIATLKESLLSALKCEDDKEKMTFKMTKMDKTAPTDIASNLSCPESNTLKAANLQARSSSTPESTDKLEVVYTRDQSSLSPVSDYANSDDDYFDTYAKGKTQSSLDADDITVDVKSQRKNNTPHADDKNEDKNSLEDSASIPETDNDNTNDDGNASRKPVSISEFDDKSNTNTEGKPSSKTDDDGNSDEDESMQRERPSTHDSDDKSNINEERELSSKTDPIDSLIHGNLPSVSGSEDNNDETSAPETLSSTPDLTTNIPKTEKTRVIEERDGISFLNILSPGEHGEHSRASSEERKQAAQGEYPMTKNPRGCAVIFNIETFRKIPDDPTSRQLENRHGSSKDAEGLKEAFEKLHFIVDRYDDKAINEIITITDVFASMDHSSFDCFVLCILTHGSEGQLYDANGRSFQFERIFKKFHADKCPTLSGKPKLFFLQACQGNQCQIGNNPQADIVSLRPGSINNVREVKANFLEGNSPNEADFLVFFPARLGLPAFRNDNQGSWFIQSLVENLNKHGESLPLFEIFTKVINEVSSRRVADQCGNHYDQTPKFDTSLKMTVFFRPIDE